MTAAVCEAAKGKTQCCALKVGHRGEHVFRARAKLDGIGAPLKVCPRCGVAQSLADAFQHRSDGSVFSWCKSCNRAYAKERRAARAG